jgi:integrase/recombinase XerD
MPSISVLRIRCPNPDCPDHRHSGKSNACRSFQEKLVVWVLLDTGLRVSEFCNLRRDQVHWQENCVVVWGKGGWYGKRARGGLCR